MKRLKTCITMLLVGLVMTSCSAKTKIKSIKEALEIAKQSNEMVFLVVTSDDVASIVSLTSLVKDVAKDIKKSTIIEMNINDINNKNIVEEYRLSNAPMPMILLISNKGVVLVGMPESSITKESLTEAIPTPKYGDIVYEISKSTPVFVILSNKTFKSNNDVNSICEKAKKEMSNKAQIIVVNPNDEKEKKLIQMLNIKTQLEDSFIVVINGQGVMSGRFDTIPSMEELISAANVVKQTGCAPGGCGPTCK